MSRTLAQQAERPLPPAAMTQAMERIMAGSVPPEEIRGFLQAMAARGETAEEIAAAVGVLRAHATPLPLSTRLELCDTCGTGGDQQHTINVSTLAAFVAAAAGVKVSKHGNRAASSRCGSADVLAALGLNLEAPPAVVARCIEELGIGFCFAPVFHPAMKVVAPVRKALGIRTIFNLLGPLANPAPLTFQVIGVSDTALLAPMARAMQALGIRHGLVVHGVDGLDEVTITGETDLLEVTPSGIRPMRLHPEDVGLTPATLDDLRGGDPAQNAQLAREILQGQPSPKRELVALNAGCALYAADRASTIVAGVSMAQQVLASGAAWTLLEKVVAATKAS